MSDHQIMIGRSLCRNFAHHWSRHSFAVLWIMYMEYETSEQSENQLSFTSRSEFFTVSVNVFVTVMSTFVSHCIDHLESVSLFFHRYVLVHTYYTYISISCDFFTAIMFTCMLALSRAAIYVKQHGYCAQHNFSYTRGWMKMVFYCYMILKQIDTVRHDSRLQLSKLQQILAHDTHSDTYSVHKGSLVLCRAHSPCLLTSWGRLTSSTVWCQLPVFFPAWRAGPPSFPCTQDGPISPRVHAHLCPLVRYSYTVLLWGLSDSQATK
jgi:hypothetical protein